jgi:hypothetical protein
MSVSKFLRLILLLFVIQSCSTGQFGGSNTPSEDEQKTFYQREIQPIFNASCAGGGCHIGGNAGNVRLDWYSRTLESVGSKLGRIIIPRNSDSSPLIQVLSGSNNGVPQMPIGFPALSDEQIQKLKAWIDNDALED